MQVIFNKLREIERIELMPHPEDNPDLAFSDYFMLRSTAHFPEQVEGSAKEGFLFRRTRTCINVETNNRQKVQYNALYFECKVAFGVTWTINCQNIARLLTHPIIFFRLNF